jgi:rhamnosyltransferase
MEVLVSVIIPVKNGEATLKRCLESIKEQSIAGELEIIALDSESTDSSRQILNQYGATIINIPAGEFNHGLTRGEAVRYASGDLLFYTVQDAFLPDRNVLKQMIAYFEDAEVQSVTGHQAVPHERDKNPMQWLNRITEPVSEIRHFSEPHAFDMLPVKKKVQLAAWDDVVAMYRKKALTDLPFAETNFGEDCIWAYQALSKGWKLIYAPELVVYHYHHRNFSYSFKTAFALNYHLYIFLNYRPGVPPVFLPMARAVYQIVKNNNFSAKEKIYWIWHNWEGLWGSFYSNAYFRVTLFTGGKNLLQKAYSTICKQVPIGKQKK